MKPARRRIGHAKTVDSAQEARCFMWWKRSCPFGVVVLSTVVLADCAGRQTAQLEPSGLDLSGVDVVDLSYAYDEATLYWPTSPTTFELTSLAYGPAEGGYFYAANTFCTPEHGGTHIDAPIHFAEGGWTLGEVPIRHLVAPGVVIDVSLPQPRIQTTVSPKRTFGRGSEPTARSRPAPSCCCAPVGVAGGPMPWTIWGMTHPVTPRTFIFLAMGSRQLGS